MKLTIVAATGRVGRHVLEQAVTDGHDVTALVRSPDRLTRPVHAVAADLSAPRSAAVEAAVEGVDAVVSCLGPCGRTGGGVAGPGTRALVEAMRTAGVRRIVALSASPLSTLPSAGRPDPPRRDPGEGPFMSRVYTPLAHRLLAAPFADLAEMEDVLRGSGLDWTVVRPPRLTDHPLSGAYRTALDRNLPHGMWAARADVAHCMLSAVEDDGTIGHAVGVAD